MGRMSRKLEKKAARPLRRGLGAWLELLRIPNFTTIPGDPVAGFLLAGAGSVDALSHLSFAILSSLLLYAAGLILNDVADVEVDRRERPQRPIPSGRIGHEAARRAGWTFMLAGIATGSAMGWHGVAVALLLSGLISAYTFRLKATPMGPWLLGLCRMLNLAMGAAAAGVLSTPWWCGALSIGLYILVVSRLAHREMESAARGFAVWLPAITIILAMGTLVRVTAVTGENQVRVAAAFFFAFLLASRAALRLRAPQPAPDAIGILITALIPMQAALALGAGEGIGCALAGFGLLALFPVNRLLARSFHAS